MTEQPLDDGFKRAILLLLERIAVALETPKLAENVFREHTAEGDPDYLAALAAEVEGRIQGGATPSVGRCVELNEDENEGLEHVREGIHVNLLQQPRSTIGSLGALAPDDKYILLAYEKEDPVYTAAVEILYSNLSQDMWGTDKAGSQINSLLEMHNPS